MSSRGGWLRDSLLYVLGGSLGTPCRGGTGGPSSGRRERGGEGRGIFLEMEVGVIGVGGGSGGEEEEAAGAEHMEGEEEVVAGKKA